MPEGQAFSGAGDAEAGRVYRDFAAPLRLNATLTLKIWSVIYLPGVLMALVWIVFLFHSMVDRIKVTSASERARETERETDKELIVFS